MINKYMIVLYRYLHRYLW